MTVIVEDIDDRINENNDYGKKNYYRNSEPVHDNHTKTKADQKIGSKKKREPHSKSSHKRHGSSSTHKKKKRG